MVKTTKQTPLTLENFKLLLPTIENSILPKVDRLIKVQINELKKDLTEQISHLPTKEEYFAREDKTMGELKKLREEVALTGQHYEDTNIRIDRIDKFIGFNSNIS